MHPAKALFSVLSKLAGKTPLDIYCEYLENGMDMRLDFRTMAEVTKCDKETAGKFFGGENDNPRFFTLFNTSNCLMLCRATGVHFSIYTPSNRKIFDPTCVYKFSNGRFSKMHQLIFRSDGRSGAQFEVAAEPLDPARSELGFVSKMTPSHDDPLSAIGQLLGADLSQLEDLVDLCMAPEVLCKQLQFDVLIVAHLGINATPSLVTRGNPESRLKNNAFSQLGKFSSPSPSGEIRVVGLTRNLRMKWLAYFVVDEVRELVLDPEIREPPLADVHQQQFPSKVLDLDPQSWDPEDETDEEEEDAPPCTCPMCEMSHASYKNNIPARGPQKRHASKMELSDYLILFGLDSAENLARLKRCLDLGSASLDIESLTTWSVSHTEGGAKLESVSSSKTQTGQVAVQLPVLIAYGDSFSDEVSHYREFEVHEKPGESMSNFIDHLNSRREKLEARKLSLLGFLSEFLSGVEEAHHEFFRSKGETEQLARDVFSRTVFGRCRNHLQWVCSHLAVLTLNGSGYDYPIMYKQLARSLRDRGLSLKLLKNGTRINKMSYSADVGKSIAFHDLSAMLLPGTSLDKLAKMTELQVSKMRFPFSKFTSVAFLKESSLPADPKDWFDSLTQTTPKHREVLSAMEDFRKQGCKNVGEYLSAYLKSTSIFFPPFLQD